MILSFFGIGLSQDELPHSISFENKRARVCQLDPQQVVSEFLRAEKVKRAKHYLLRRGIKPWTKWDYSNTTWKWLRVAKRQAAERRS